MKRMLNQNLIDFLNSLGDSLKYESSSNTFEIGPSLEVDSNLNVNGDTIFNGDLVSYRDSSFTFYEGDNSQTPSMGVSPLFDVNQLIFFYNDGQAIDSATMLDVSVDANILTNKNTKTIFGKSIQKDSENNIDLYKHYLTINVEDETSNITDTFSILVQSSSNVDCSSATGATQKLKDLLKASGPSVRTYEYGPNSDFSSMGMLLWTGSILCITASDGELNIVKIVDRVETL